jgi:hypothetical protein
MPMNEPTLNVGHPIYSVFMKCWRFKPSRSWNMTAMEASGVPTVGNS